MDGHMHDMGGMHGMEPSANGNMAMPHMKKHFMHMTFFWGKDSEILFNHWPGDKTDSYTPSEGWSLILGDASAHVFQWWSVLGCCGWSCFRVLYLSQRRF